MQHCHACMVPIELTSWHFLFGCVDSACPSFGPWASIHRQAGHQWVLHQQNCAPIKQFTSCLRNKGSHSVFLERYIQSSLGGLTTLVVIVRGRCRSGLSASLNHIRQVFRILDGKLAPSVSLESTWGLQSNTWVTTPAWQAIKKSTPYLHTLVVASMKRKTRTQSLERRRDSTFIFGSSRYMHMTYPYADSNLVKLNLWLHEYCTGQHEVKV